MSEFGSRIVARQNVFNDGTYSLEAIVISIDSPGQFIDKEIVFKKEIQIGKSELQKTKATTGNKTMTSDSDKGTKEKSIKNEPKKPVSKDKSKTLKDKTKPKPIK